MKRLIALACAVLTVAVMMAFSPVRKAVAFAPPAGEGTACAPSNVNAYSGTDYSFWNFVEYEMFNNSRAISVNSSITYDCPCTPPAGNCSPCWTIRLYRDLAFQPSVWDTSVTPNWVDMGKAQSYFQVPISAMDGSCCSTGNTGTLSIVCNNLAPGRYRLYIEYGAGDDRRCYILNSFTYTFYCHL